MQWSLNDSSVRLEEIKDRLDIDAKELSAIRVVYLGKGVKSTWLGLYSIKLGVRHEGHTLSLSLSLCPLLT